MGTNTHNPVSVSGRYQRRFEEHSPYAARLPSIRSTAPRVAGPVTDFDVYVYATAAALHGALITSNA